MPVSEDLATFLASRLAKNTRLRVHHVSTPPTSCSPLFAPGPGQIAQKTWCESHFLALSQNPVTDPDRGSSLLVLGLEVLIFTTENLTTIFVSKADSTGFLIRQPVSNRASSVAFAITTAFLEYLVRPRLTRSRLVLSLFARSQNQYLFPGSIENNSKRILDDRQLIKWWCRVLDPIVRSRSLLPDATSQLDIKAYVVVPGCEKAETKAFFPPSARFDQPTESVWINQYPAALLTPSLMGPPRCLVPRLPDDPKARFLDDLDGTQVNDDGSWKGVKSLDQFWEMMSYRQECSAGRLVGFIWAIFSQPESKPPHPSTAAEAKSDEAITDSKDVAGLNTSPEQPVCGSDLTIDAENVNTSSEGMTRPDVSGIEKPISWPELGRGELILSVEQYSSLMDYLLQLDFAGEEIAKKSTKDWIDRAKDAASVTDFGVDVEGNHVPTEITRADTAAVPAANIITAVRKKRKADPSPSTNPAEDASINTLGLDLIRKKPKA